MSKTSAKSKGFRKQPKTNKPYLSKKEIIITVIVIVLIVAAFIVMNNIPDGSVKIANGTAVVQGENPILNTVTQANGKLHYFKLGEMHEVEGYTLAADSRSEDVSNYNSYTFTPEGESAIDTVTVTGVASSVSTKTDAETYCAYNQAYSTQYAVEGMAVGEVNELATESGKKVYYYTYTLDDATYQASLEAAAEEAATEETATEETATEEAAEETATEEVATEEAAEETAEEEATEETAEETAEEATEETAEEATEEATEVEATEEVAEEATEEPATEEASEEEATEETATEEVSEEDATEETATEEVAEEATEETATEEVSEEEATEEAVEEAEVTQNFHQNVVAYVETDTNYFIYIAITNDADAAEEYLTDEQITETVSTFANAITFETK